MRYIILFILCLSIPIFAYANISQEDQLLRDNCVDTDFTNILGVKEECLRTGNISIVLIPIMIVSIIRALLGVAGSISVVALIYHAVRMQLSSGITGDSSGVEKAKSGMKSSILGFILAMSGWFIMTKFIEILGTYT